MKVCTKCKKKLLDSKFNWKVKGVRRSSHCKNCSRNYVRSHYNKNKVYYIKKAKLWNQEFRSHAQKYILKYLINHPCVDCGEKDILVLEFDHRDKTRKDGDVSRIIRSKPRFSILVEEIGKCDVRCANCHRRKTAIENNSWKLNMRP